MLDPDGHPFLAAILDVAMAPLAGSRRAIVPRARGRVLEIGLGTGANLPHYTDVDEVIGVEPDPHMRKRAAVRIADAPFPVTLLDVGAERLPLPDDHVDTVVATFVLCTIPDPDAAAAELRRVLRPGGRLLFAEHTASAHRPEADLQHLIDPVWCRLAGGCHLTRDSLDVLRRAGFTLEVEPNPHPRVTLAPVYRGEGW